MNSGEILKNMADRLEVSSAFLSAIENGKKRMPPSMREKVVTLYGLKPEEIDDLDNAILESADSVEISIRSLSEERKKLAVTFARSFGEFSDEDICHITEYLKNRNKEN